MRVLRPAIAQGRATTPGDEEPKALEPMVDEAADANAIEVGTIFV